MTDGKSLEELRHDIDRIDDAIQELLWQRSAIVEKVRAYKLTQRVFRRGGFFRPGREAEILRRLVRRHRGRFPKLGLVQVWRAIVASHLAHQEHFSLAVYRPKLKNACWELAREQYGPLVPMVAESSVTAVLRKVSERSASAGVLPLPKKKDEAWWRHLVGRFADLRIVAGLPFANFESEKGEVEALIVAPMPAEHTGKDRSFLAIESNGGISAVRLATALAQEKIRGRSVLAWRSSVRSSRSFSLIEVEGFFGEDAPILNRVRTRLGRSVRRIAVVGSYAVPLHGAKGKRNRKSPRGQSKS